MTIWEKDSSVFLMTHQQVSSEKKQKHFDPRCLAVIQVVGLRNINPEMSTIDLLL